MGRLTLIRGLPGSGKSTLAKALCSMLNSDEVYTTHLEADMYFVDKTTGVYEYNRMEIGDAHEWCQSETYSELMAGRSVIVSNTFTKMSEMESYFHIAQDCLGTVPNIILCQGDYGSVHGVPENIMENMRKRFEYNITPLWDSFNPLVNFGEDK